MNNSLPNYEGTVRRGQHEQGVATGLGKGQLPEQEIYLTINLQTVFY